MSRLYAKPLRGGGSRIIERDSSGRFQRGSLDAEICGCGGISLPELVNVGSDESPLMKRVRPAYCHLCNAPMPRGGEYA